MISDNQSICPKCGGQLKYYDHVQRLVRTKFGNKKWVAIRRLRCCKCHAVHRELPDFIFPYKQYEADIIIGVLEGLITCETLGFEDYPCEMTMIRWRLFPLMSRQKIRMLFSLQTLRTSSTATIIHPERVFEM